MSGLFDDCGGSSDRGNSFGVSVSCSPSQVAAATAAIAQMNTLFKTAGSPAQYVADVAAINAEKKAYDDALIFYNDCDYVTTGQAAQALAQKIAAATGQELPSTQPLLNPSLGLGDVVGILKTVLVIGGLGYGLKVLHDTYKGGPTPPRARVRDADNPDDQMEAYDRFKRQTGFDDAG